MLPGDSIGGVEAVQHHPENIPLRRALTRLATQRSRENRARVYEHLLNGPILVAITELPREPAPRRSGLEASCDSCILDNPLPLRFATARGPSEERALAVFSDPAAVAARDPSSVWLAIEPHTLLHWIAHSDCGGMVLNPQGLSAFVPRADIEELAGLRSPSQSGGSQARRRASTESAILGALNHLYDDENPRAFLVLAEEKTKKAVQFARALDGSLTLDVFASSLTGAEIGRARQIFAGIEGYVGELPEPARDPGAIGGIDSRTNTADFKAIFRGDVAHATQSAMKIFTWVYGFPPSFDLNIEMR